MRSTSEPKEKKKAKRRRTSKPAPSIVGWREWAGLPELGVARLKAKIDTGARTSALHAVRIRAFEQGGVVVAAFAIHPVQRRTAPEIDCLARVIDRRRIRSSNGLSALRYVIVTTLRLGGAEFPIELSLADRDEMGFRLLLGRDALKNRFVVDPAKSFRTGK